MTNATDIPIVLIHGFSVQVLEHLENVVGELDTPPILMGHSAGGVFTQLMLDRGHGVVGVAINSAAPEGIPVTSSRATRTRRSTSRTTSARRCRSSRAARTT